jgi:hypothetical protein
MRSGFAGAETWAHALRSTESGRPTVPLSLAASILEQARGFRLRIQEEEGRQRLLVSRRRHVPFRRQVSEKALDLRRPIDRGCRKRWKRMNRRTQNR